MNIWDNPQVCLIFKALGPSARIVGGAVRDYMVGITPADIDFTTPLKPDDIICRLQQHHIPYLTVGIKHGTVTAMVDNHPYEITTLRTDIKTDGRHAVVGFTNSYETDAKRRDFTINALYMGHDGHIDDFTGGINDLRNKYVRFIGNASQRVQEDYLRILRYFRFWGQLGSGKKNPSAVMACKTYANRLANISMERKRQEFYRILMLPCADKVCRFMYQTGVLQMILPNIQDNNIKLFKQYLRLRPDADLTERLSCLYDGKSPVLGLSAKKLKELSELATETVISRDLQTEQLHLYKMGTKVYHHHVYRAWATKQITRRWACTLLNLERPIYPIRGKDLVDIGIPVGPNIKKMMTAGELLWAKKGFTNDKKLVLNQILSYNKSIQE